MFATVGAMRDHRRVVLITGASGELGTACCRALAHTHDVLAVYHTTPPKGATQDRSTIDPLNPGVRPDAGAPQPVYAVRADLTLDADLDRVVEVGLARFGRIDVIVNAAAAAISASLLNEQAFGQALQAMVAVNLLAPIKLSALVTRQCWREDPVGNKALNRNVINVSCASGVHMNQRPKLAGHAATKAALNFLSCHLAAELNPLAVRVNAVAPARFPNPVPTSRVVESVQRLDQGRMTGRVLLVDGRGSRFVE